MTEEEEIETVHTASHAPFGCPYSDDTVHECGLYRRARARILGDDQ